MASSTKSGVDLNLTQEARDKIAARAKTQVEAKEKIARERRVRKDHRRLGQKLASKVGSECKLKYDDKAACLASGKPYSSNDKCSVCKRGGKI